MSFFARPNFSLIRNIFMTRCISTSKSRLRAPAINNESLFNNELPSIKYSLITSPKISQIPELSSWVEKVLDHNLQGGKRTRGIMTTLAYDLLEKPENITEEYRKLSRVLGWCLELLQAYFCMIDDVMDGATTRRGEPCWYRMPDVGMGALNDAILVSSAVKELLEMHFLKTPHFIHLTLLFNETILFTCMGQHIDFTMAHHTNRNYSLFTTERYETLVRYKTSYYTFRLPILLGLTLVKDVDKNMYAEIDEISFKLGHLFQIQDDYIDCYGDEKLTGKAGTDIQEGKCTWLAATALELCNETQRDTFTKHYASKKLDDVAIIKGLYNELRIPALYKEKENEIYNDTIRRIQQLSRETAPNFFFRIMDTIHNRQR